MDPLVLIMFTMACISSCKSFILRLPCRRAPGSSSVSRIRSITTIVTTDPTVARQYPLVSLLDPLSTLSTPDTLQCIISRDLSLGALQVSFKGPQVSKTEKPYYIDFSLSKRHQDTHPELLTRAIGTRCHTVVDLTVGLGRDALVLCSRGTKVIGVEKCYILHALLQDALTRLHTTQPGMVSNMTLLHGAAENLVGRIAQILTQNTQNGYGNVNGYGYGYGVCNGDGVSDGVYTDRNSVHGVGSGDGECASGDGIWDGVCVYLDPMYPLSPEERTSKSKKDTQILHRLADRHTHTSDASLFACALTIPGVRRIVVKRGGGHPPLVSEEVRRVDGCIRGRTQRFDIYIVKR